METVLEKRQARTLIFSCIERCRSSEWLTGGTKATILRPSGLIFLKAEESRILCLGHAGSLQLPDVALACKIALFANAAIELQPETQFSRDLNHFFNGLARLDCA